MVEALSGERYGLSGDPLILSLGMGTCQCVCARCFGLFHWALRSDILIFSIKICQHH